MQACCHEIKTERVLVIEDGGSRLEDCKGITRAIIEFLKKSYHIIMYMVGEMIVEEKDDDGLVRSFENSQKLDKQCLGLEMIRHQV